MPLKIAFLGRNAYWTRFYLRQFAQDNAEQIASYDDRAARLLLRDGTQIFGILSARPHGGLLIDQIILADDRRMEIYAERHLTITWLRCIQARSPVPAEFATQIYNTEAGR